MLVVTVWDHRLVNRGEYVIRRDRIEMFHVSMSGETHPSVMVRHFVAACARVHGGTVASESQIAETVMVAGG